MQKPLTVLVFAGMMLSACGGWRESRVNPSNWFGPSNPAPVATATEGEVNPLIPRNSGKGLFDRPDAVDATVPITRVTELKVEPTTTGAIVYAVGVANRQGAYDAELRRVISDENTEAGIIAYTFRVNYPREATPQGPENTRTVRAAANLSRKDLAGIKLIRVEGQQGALESRRR
ncbi:hypothetical protein [Ruegeria marina]|uniref:Lipoprotein n=1 Tax=Ruegeria marina TaxID=639004 RepID=A0A1G6IG93_9RHOB|nr:hypothetical protein [Ruegeria marina]SDC05413.1 hypothetical protein SAMN04488239_101114 [Ruegeria marina]